MAVESACAACGEPLSKNDAFCRQCGAPLAGEEATASQRIWWVAGTTAAVVVVAVTAWAIATGGRDSTEVDRVTVDPGLEATARTARTATEAPTTVTSTTAVATTTLPPPPPSPPPAAAASQSWTCGDPQLDGDALGNALAAAFPGFDTWADSPDFFEVARPLVLSMVDACGEDHVRAALEWVGVVGPTWRALSSILWEL